MKKKAAWALVTLGVVFLAIQVVPVDRRNPPVESEVPAPPELRSVLRRACYDCHSNETVWPWYSRVAPISWLVASDVHEGRGALNLSTWNRLSAKEQSKAREKLWKEVAEGEMPLWYYLPAHPAARLSPRDKSLLREWVVSGTPGGSASK
jgi:cytochrome c551/c552